MQNKTSQPQTENAGSRIAGAFERLLREIDEIRGQADRTGEPIVLPADPAIRAFLSSCGRGRQILARARFAA